MVMMRRIVSSQSKTITGAAIIIGAMSLVSRLTGVLRDRLFAHYFGAGDILDAYYAAFRVPDFIYNLLIVGALSAGFIPVFMEAMKKDGARAGRMVDNIITILGISLAVMCVALFFLAPALTHAIVPGYTGQKLDLTVIMTRVMLLSPIILGISSVVSGVLQSFKNFLVYSLSPIAYNIGIITGALLLAPILGPVGLAWGVILGAILHLSIQLPTLRGHGFRYRPFIDLKDSSVRTIARLSGPRIVGLAAHQINFIVTTTLASTLAAGSVAVFNFANNLQYFAVGIIGYSFSIAAFPTLSELAARKDTRALAEHIGLSIRQILFLIIPSTVLFLLLRAQIVRVVLGTGAFNWDATILTANTLAFFTLSLFAQTLIPLIARSFYALQDTLTPFVIAIVSALVNIVASLYLKNSMGVAGLALAFSIAAILQLILLLVAIKKKVGAFEHIDMLRGIYKISAAALLMAATVQLLKTPLSRVVDMTAFLGIFTQGLVAGLAGLFVYGAVCFGLKLEAMEIFYFSLKKRWLRLRKIQGEIHEADEV